MGVSSSSCGLAMPCSTAVYVPTALLAALLARRGMGSPSNFSSFGTTPFSVGCSFIGQFHRFDQLLHGCPLMR
eukprot:10069979-Ditylum_brightwellii.AAC.1